MGDSAMCQFQLTKKKGRDRMMRLSIFLGIKNWIKKHIYFGNRKGTIRIHIERFARIVFVPSPTAYALSSERSKHRLTLSF